VRKMTSMPATAFRLDGRGLVRPGYVADLTIFDPQTVSDKATFEKPHAYAEGVRHVVVSGGLVLKDAVITGLLPGGPVYGPGTNKTADTAAVTVTARAAADAAR
jgi:N-acyl-D-amino-acid deacylase